MKIATKLKLTAAAVTAACLTVFSPGLVQATSCPVAEYNASCYPSIQEAVDAAAPNSTVQLGYGVIEECDILLDKPVRIVGKGGKVGDATRETIVDASACRNGFLVSASGVKLAQLNVVDTAADVEESKRNSNFAAVRISNWGTGTTDLEDISLTQLRIDNSFVSGIIGINLTSLDKVWIGNTQVLNSAVDGIRIGGANLADISAVSVVNSTIDGSGNVGLWLPTNVTNSRVLHSTITNHLYDVDTAKGGMAFWFKQNVAFPNEMGLEVLNNNFDNNSTSLRTSYETLPAEPFNVSYNYWGMANECPQPVGAAPTAYQLQMPGATEDDVDDAVDFGTCLAATDSDAPVLTISTLSDGGSLDLSSSADIMGSIADANLPVGVSEYMGPGVSLRVLEAGTKNVVTTASFKPWDINPVIDGSGNWTITIPGSSIPAGTYDFEFTAKDMLKTTTRQVVTNVMVTN